MGKRATKAEEKEARRRTIIQQAWALFQAGDYGAVNMIDVARAAGLAKGTVYLYFKTKEALFLAVAADRFGEWFEAMADELPAAQTTETVVTVITESLVARPGLTRLFAILHVILEHNITAAEAEAFKRLLYEGVTATGAMLEANLPFVAVGGGGGLLLRAYALAIGVQHLADPAPVVREVIGDHAELSIFDIDFAATFSDILRGVLYHLEATA
jgi:AcrR family transcriptional regulator